MTGRKTFCLVLLLLIALVLGLNTSSNGISSLTMDDRGPVLGVACDHSDQIITMTVMGTIHNIGYGDLFSASNLDRVREAAIDIKNYVRKIWRIFYAVFLY